MTFETSPSTEKLDAALAKAQGKIKIAKKNAENPHFKSSYADLASVWEACREALSENGISVTQWPIDVAPGKLTLMTRIGHAGEWMRASYSIPLGKADAHGVGGAITYAKRFALGAIVGVASEDEDDDGNTAVGKGTGRSDGGRQAAQNAQGPKQKPESPKGPSSGPKPQGGPSPASKAAPKAGAQTFREFAQSFGWTEEQAKEWATLRFQPAEGEQLTPEQYQELRQVIQTTPPDEALFMVRNP